MPVTTTEYFRAVVELQESVAEPGTVTLEGEMAMHNNPPGIAGSDKFTLPVNPPLAFNVRVETDDPPMSTTAAEDAVMSKSLTPTRTLPLLFE